MTSPNTDPTLLANENNVRYFDSLKIPIALGTNSLDQLMEYRSELEEQRERLDIDLAAINSAIAERSGDDQ